MDKRIFAAGAIAGLVLVGGAALAGPSERGEGPWRAEGGRGAGPMGVMGGPREVDFVVIDVNGDGVLSRAELQARAVERLGRLDANADGVLSRAELAAVFPAPPGAALAVFAPDPGVAMADRILAMTGATAAGQVAVVDLAGAQVNMVLTRLDANRDDALSAEEAAAGAAGPRRGWRGEGHGGPRGADDHGESHDADHATGGDDGGSRP